MPSTDTRILRKQLRKQLVERFDLAEADAMAALIIEHFFGVSMATQLLGNPLDLSPVREQQIRKIIQRLRSQEPIQYVLGYTYFFGRRFKTDPRALIPRPETEELVDFILKTGLSKHSRILDIGTGTGCIAISLQLETGCTAYALDSEAQTLSLCQENADSLNAEVTFIKADILLCQPELPPMDLIVSNPPYIPEADLGSITPRVKDFEPRKALFVPDHDPLIFYKNIADFSTKYLKPGGEIFLEIYHLAGPAIVNLFQGSGWSQVQLKKDLNGKDRMIRARYH